VCRRLQPAMFTAREIVSYSAQACGMPKLRLSCAIVKCLSERSLRKVSKCLGTYTVEALTHDSTGDEHSDISFEAIPCLAWVRSLP
jgi:hypothetical protein